MKNIVLCSDGTGNKGGYGNDTNVYKTYKAVNIHDAIDAEGGRLAQVSFYDQGVGTDKSNTSKNKYRRAIAGAFGFGFEDNVKHLYHFLARCYEPGDRIFLFGFSRGAATVRAFAGFLHACGLVDRSQGSVCTNGAFDEDKFRDRVNEAFDCYRSQNTQRQAQFKQSYAIRNAQFAPDGNLIVHFLGVWDTVSALGFPQDFSVAVEWLFKVADNLSDKIWPHQFYDYDLNDSIQHAYQALSVDDERTTFHPKIWDETRRQGHVEQVWFAGVHANVGGGYARSGLSDVSLDWMMTQAERHGLVFFDDGRQQVRDSANCHDTLYDSRDGVAAYYRYGPRHLPTLCKGKLKGPITLHATVIEKIKDLADAYAPDGLPANFAIVDNLGLTRTVGAASESLTEWATLEKQVNAVIARRALLYRVFVELTMAIIVIAGLLWWSAPDSIVQLKTSTGGGLLQLMARFMSYLSPVYFENFIYAVVWKFPLIFPLMLLTLFTLKRTRNRCVNEIDRLSRKMGELICLD